MRITLFTLLFLCFAAINAQSATGNIEDYVGALIDIAPGSTGNNYVEATNSQLIAWNTIIGLLLAEDLTGARTAANGLNYQITEFTDTSLNPNQLFYVLEEQSPQSNYWGTYVFTDTPERNNLIIQAPHSKYDTNTGKQAVYCFKNNLARAVFINGTHRCNSNALSTCSGTTSVCGSSNSYRISDLAHTTTSMFQKTTEHLLSSISNSVFIQLHGFAKQSTDPYVIMSNGTRETPSSDYAILIRDALIIEDASLTFEIAHLNTSWTRLIGFTNTQGRMINNSANFCTVSATNTTGRFIHIEQEKSKLRDNETGWSKMSNALSNTFPSTLSVHDTHLIKGPAVYPNPTNDKIFIDGINITQVELFNAFGQRLLSNKNEINANQLVIQLHSYKPGIYVLKMKLENKSVLRKIVLF